MLDFTSALYLGLWHPSASLRPWAQFTTGLPAAVADPPGAGAVAQRLAALQGCERATLARSTLHLFWDFFGLVAQGRSAVYVDSGAYAVGRWGVERAAARGIPVRSFPHQDPDALRCSLKRSLRLGTKPLVVADGLCPVCGGQAPVAAYLDLVRTYGGQLLLDDTQALGILGRSPGAEAPYGKGGGGTLPWSGVGCRDVLMISSLAKGFGVPVAALSGSNAMIEAFEARSSTRVHSSPPSIADIHAAGHALAINQERGEVLRRRLACLVHRFRRRVAQAGMAVSGGLFPVQTLAPFSILDAVTLHDRLRGAGVRTVLQRADAKQGARINFLLTARHRFEEIDRAVDLLAGTVKRVQTRAINAINPEATYAEPIRV